MNETERTVNGSGPGPFQFTEREKLAYHAGVPSLVFVCMIAVAVNGRCLAAVKWIRGTVSPTLQLSISLAAADLYISLLTLYTLVVHSYLPVVFGLSINIPLCAHLAIATMRFSGFIVVVSHLLALALNHHVGIVRPLRYPGIATGRNVRLLIAALWLLPHLAMFTTMTVQEGGFMHAEGGCPVNFLQAFNFRVCFAVTLALPLLLMLFIYCHILVVVHAQIAVWARGSIATGSCRHHGGRPTTPRDISSSKQRFQVNVRAVNTSLYILGSFVVLVLPAIFSYFLVCDRDCSFNLHSFPSLEFYLWFNTSVNLLLMLKPLANPVIYAARMQEVKEATRRMEAALRWRWCGPSSAAAARADTRNSERTKELRTTLFRLASNGSSQPQQTATVLTTKENTTVL